ncbi:hypothetical protein HK099_003938 [Clydaea vesicula]|uniref:Uncharacterized protein n=1 Tax=Clydaea vesicula TaxID=447962 RepID=A0AAD5U107_9FUNG|nr:hypothetical protein HK099_003938 [Clydaea vesicula]
MEDLWNLKKSDTASYNSEIFQNAWQNETRKKNPSLVWALCAAYGPVFLSAGIFKLGQDSLAFVQPQLLNQLVAFAKSWSTDSKQVPEPLAKGFFIACLMLISAVTQTILLHQYFHITLITSLRIKSAITTAVYKKALTLSNDSRSSSTVGEIVNLMTVDAGRVADLLGYLHILWSGPYQILLALYFLYAALGPSIFAAQMKNKDDRTKLMDELLNGIKVIKLYAWEIPFKKRVTKVRDAELDGLRKIGFLAAAQSFTWACTPFLVSFSTFLVFSIISEEKLVSEKVFGAIALFNMLQFPLNVFPNVISSLINATVTFERLFKFLSAEELDNNAVTCERVYSGPINRVEIKNASFYWTKPSENTDLRLILKNISLDCTDKTLIAVVGSVGSGKSSLINSILGEMYKSSGQVILRGSVAYIPQNAWIMNASLRENILFGKRYDEKFYNHVIEACQLRQDLDILPGGDLTEIGEKGINLSGGQKQRVSIARAAYFDADIYLFDDPLSAVDQHVGKHIFDNVIGNNGLLKDKARILVTHGIHFLPKCDRIISLAEGEIRESGTYSQLMKNETYFYELIKTYGKKKDVTNATDSPTPNADDAKIALEKALVVKNKGFSKEKETELMKSLNIAPNMAITPSNLIILKEEGAKGSVSWSVYKSYAESCSFRSVVLYLIILFLTQASSVFQNVFLADWAHSNDKIKKKISISYEDNDNGMSDEVIWRLGVYGLLGIVFSVSTVLQTIFIWVYCGMRSAKVLHQQMLDNILKLPQSFFDTTPLGRIMNRFSKDQNTIDETLPRTFHGYFRTLFSVLSVLAVNSFSSPLFLVFAIPLGYLYIFFQRYYISTSRELKRLDSISRSPVYAHFQETLGGLATIRAYKQEKRFLATNEDRVDYNQRAAFPSICSNRWLAVRLEFIGSLIVFGSANFSVVSILATGTVNQSIAGLCLTYSLTVTQTLNWMVRMSCDIESQIISVERIKEYMELPNEAPFKIEGVNPPRDWPNGKIEFKKYGCRYREGLDLVLKEVDFQVMPREKIGIVGRTGAGKSSLTVALFRLIEPSMGTIVIDGVDIRILGLHDLRSRLTIIPQDPFVFSGTIRENLDPFEEYDDSTLWKALESASLKTAVSKLDKKLDALVVQGGENFSVGQRQLMCLARALLRKTNILILDEATAAIDVETDNVIQQTIRQEFKNCTILTIAHRINTVLDSDKILVLDQGKVTEFDEPKKLLEMKNSKFYALAKEAGLV